MIGQKQDRDLEEALACYRVPDMGGASRAALLERIVAAAGETPQQPCAAPRFGVPAWGASAALLVIVAVSGFWIGGGVSRPASSYRTIAAYEADSSADRYLNQMIFGSKSWREVSL